MSGPTKNATRNVYGYSPESRRTNLVSSWDKYMHCRGLNFKSPDYQRRSSTRGWKEFYSMTACKGNIYV